MRFALIGAAGYVAPRHMAAIKAIGGELVAAYDPSDSVGVLDRYFEGCEFFTEFERFDRHIAKLSRSAPVDYVSICSPNYLHDAHCRWAMRSGADAICEKPLVIKPHNLEGLALVENETGRKVWSILQMRLHAGILQAKEKYGAARCEVAVDYVTPRGRWYDRSWKADSGKSGGLLMNIGVHLFDVLGVMFGGLHSEPQAEIDERRATGTFDLERARVKFMLSLDRSDLPAGKAAHRVLSINGEAFDISDGFTDLHTKSYQEIMAGRGFGIDDCRPGIEVVAALKSSAKERACA